MGYNTKCSSARHGSSISGCRTKSFWSKYFLVKSFTWTGGWVLALPTLEYEDRSDGFESHWMQNSTNYLHCFNAQSLPLSPIILIWLKQCWKGRKTPNHHQQPVQVDHEIFATVILPFLLIQEGQLSVSGKRMCTSTGKLLRGLSLSRKSVVS